MSPELLYQRDEWPITGLLLALLLIAAEFGFRRGRRVAAQFSAATRSELATLQAALGGLLALLLAFTFAMATARFESRKQLVIEEANAVATATLLAKMQTAPYRQTARDLLRQYLDQRLIACEVAVGSPALREADARLANLQQELWQVALRAAAKNPNVVPTGLFINSLGAVFDARAKRDAERDNHVPETVLLLLFLIAILTMELVGYGCGLAGHRHFGAMIAVALAITLVILIIIDLDRPLRGLIRVSQQNMIDLRQSLDQPDLPP
jgi:hypothetical protein